jgi:Mrp family chromosome partitioning ATPase
MQRGLPQRRSIKDVKKVIAVSSAKGGVGKSTIAGTSPTALVVIHTETHNSKPRSQLRT